LESVVSLESVVLQTTIAGLAPPVRGKVRDVYFLDADRLLLVATDRLSAFDVVMNQGIPGKGRVLTQISAFWFGITKEIVPNHLISANDSEIAAALASVGAVWTEALSGRAMLCQRTKPLMVEAVVRGYLSGSMWKDYSTLGNTLWGHVLPEDLVESDQLATPIFTPSTKAEHGAHDAPMTEAEARALLGEHFDSVHNAAIKLYAFGRDFAAERGILLADTKFEFGVDPQNRVILIDEALTPDSSRFWPAELYQSGGPQSSFDKQFVRDYLETQVWNKKAPAPDLPASIIEKTADKYRDAYQKLTGGTL
jgi:phosphoribosylaminoimidazole-succinocarboxamide synthase